MKIKWTDALKAAVKVGAPTLGGLLGGPAGSVAANIVLDHFGLNSESDQDAVEEAILKSGNADALIKLREIDNDFKAKMEAAGIRLAEVQVGDLANARSRETLLRDWTPAILAYGSLIAYIAFVAAMFFVTIPDTGASTTMLNRADATLSNLTLIAFTYYLGSSAGSLRRGETIDRALPAAAAA